MGFIFYHDNYSADKEAARKKKKKVRAVGEQVGDTPVSQSKIGSQTLDGTKKAGMVVKKSIQPDGQLSKENLTRDPKEVLLSSSCFFFLFLQAGPSVIKQTL